MWRTEDPTTSCLHRRSYKTRSARRDAHRQWTHYQNQLPHTRSRVSVSLPDHQHLPQRNAGIYRRFSLWDNRCEFCRTRVFDLTPHTDSQFSFSPPLLFCSNVTIAESGKNVWSVVPSVKHGPWFRFYLSRTGSISGVLRAPKPKQGVQDFVCAAQIVAKRMCRWCDFVVFNSETNQIDNPKWCSCTCLHIWLVL